MIRTYQAEDKDYIINSHYEIFSKEQQYDLSFKDFIAEKVNSIIERADERECIWILESNGKNSGSICIQKADDDTAQLGLFLIEPDVRGGGFGKQLVQTAIAFSREKGYKSIILYTNDKLASARGIYQKHGFQLKETKTIHVSNQELQEECWELPLTLQNSN